jgi:hypothetical protein
VLRRGHSDEAVYDAVRAVHPADDLDTYIDAINALGQQAAA